MPTQPTNSAKKTSSDNLNRQLSLYSLAAAVAGVSLLALSEPAAGEVLVTKKNIPIPLNPFGDPFGTVPISLTNNGVNDFSFSLYDFSYTGNRSLRAWPLEGGAVVGQPGAHGPFYASALMRGAKIGASAQFSTNQIVRIEESFSAGGSSRFKGLWGGNPKNRFLGVRFLINGETHYGWIRLTVTTASRGPMSATITGYAYETIANKRILAGISGSTASSGTSGENQAPAPSLGMLALGADALPVWRQQPSTEK